jgi:uncharacterized coiled-coil DUF342 family protein
MTQISNKKQIKNGENSISGLSNRVDKLSNKSDVLSNRVDGLSNRVDKLSDRVDDLSCKIDVLSDKYDKKFESVDKRFDEVDKKFDYVMTKLFEHDRRFEVLEERTALIPAIYDKMDKFIREVIDNRQDRVFTNNRLDKHERRIVKLEKAIL